VDGGNHVDFAAIREADTLLTKPPPRMEAVLNLIHRLTTTSTS
jgi:hypothetical protein